MKLPNIELVKQMINKGYILVRKHPTVDLFIYNYSKQASAEHVWNAATEFCRGIICDKEYNIVARPFTKFYNYEELINNNIKIPNEPFEVYEKLDGSLGIMYFIDGNPYIATRGSFDSEQAKHATKLLYSKYSNILHLLDQTKTYLFEIIIPHGVESNLVVNYGNIDDIFLLAVIDTETGNEYNIENYKQLFKCATKYDNVSDYLKFKDESNGANREGFIIKFNSGFRMKLKFAEYFRAHAAKSVITIKGIFDAIMNGTCNELRKKVESSLTEEDVIYFDELVNELYHKYNEIESICKSEYRSDFGSRPDTAKYFRTCTYPHILFAMLDGKNYSSMIWKIVHNNI